MNRSPSLGGNISAARFLEGALVFTFCAHAAAMLSMLLLLPALPGPTATTIVARATYIADHPWLWRLGWLPWQITAVSDLTLALALLCTRWIPKFPAALGVIATVAAMIPDQGGQFQWTWIGTSVARDALRSGKLDSYARFESHIFTLVGGWGAFGYLIGALFWTWCFAAAGVWSKRLTLLSIGVWSVFGVSVTLLLLAPKIEAGSGVMTLVSAGNAVAFVLLMIWIFEVGEAVFKRSRPLAAHGLHAPFRHPSHGSLSRIYDFIANSHFARAIAHLFPILAMDSDITNVVYVNYLVEADRLERFIVPPLKLQRLGPDGRYAFFTFLTFNHGHFGPRCFGPLRRLWPSPIQSNWRIHVYDPLTGKRGIQFLTIGIGATRYALAARLLAANIPMHVTAKAQLTRTADDIIRLQLDPGDGTSPDAQATLAPYREPSLLYPWDICFGAWRQMLEYCVPQDRAMSAQPWLGRVSRQEIALNIPLETCRPVCGSVTSKAAGGIAGRTMPLCFVVDRLAFRLLNEEFDYYE